MSTSLRRRLRAIEKKAYRDDEILTLTWGDMTFTTTAGELTRLIASVQGSCLKPVPFDDCSEPQMETE
jgi:hypothetical protein